MNSPLRSVMLTALRTCEAIAADDAHRVATAHFEVDAFQRPELSIVGMTGLAQEARQTRQNC
ncbi:hypothetical protein ACDH50_20090, partial [Xanthomonas fragariae]|uniref:hypothetical protein n=1 Tax=Xanthomonas fragariae TaxID=48664 RepID=UPI0035312284